MDSFFNFLCEIFYNDAYFKILNYPILVGQLFYCHEKYKDKYEYFKKILLSYLVRRNICEYDTKGITSVIPTIIPNIIKDYSFFNELTIREFFEKKNSTNNAKFPTDDELLQKLKTTNFYCKKNISLKVLKLIECNTYGKSKDTNNLSTNASVEHIYPQNPKQNE
jgi:hypothetical protein